MHAADDQARFDDTAPTSVTASDAHGPSAVLPAIGLQEIDTARRYAEAAHAASTRRSELVALRLADIERTDAGLRVSIRRGKTDQEGAGALIAIPEGRRIRPKALLDAWIESIRICGVATTAGCDRA